jgi:hypothetical protein
MMLRIALLATALAWSSIVPAYSKPGDRRGYNQPPSDQEIELYRDMTVKAAKMAVQDNAAKVEITFFTLIMSVANYPHACGYVTPSLTRSRHTFSFPFWGRARVLGLGSLHDDQFKEAMALCEFPPWPASEEYFWGDLNFRL